MKFCDPAVLYTAVGVDEGGCFASGRAIMCIPDDQLLLVLLFVCCCLGSLAVRPVVNKAKPGQKAKEYAHDRRGGLI